MPQTIIGIDPGLRHTGYAVLQDGKVVEHGVILAKGYGKLPISDAIRVACGGIAPILARYHPDAVAVEQVGWYGSRKNITLPLSHVAGALGGLVLSMGAVLYLLLAAQRRPVALKRPRRGWQEHDLDAYELAIRAKQHLDVVAAGGTSIPRDLLAVAKRSITIPKIAHGQL